MPLFSAFTPFGILKFSAAPSELANQYTALGAQLDQALDTTPAMPASEDNEAQKYATARHLARINLTLQRAGLQRNVAKALDLLALREADFLVTPGPFDTLYKRQQRLVALRALPLGANASNVSNALAALLGAAFLKLRLVAASERATDLPTSNFRPLSAESKWCQLAKPVAVTGLQWVTYTNLDPTIATPTLFSLNDAITVQGENNAQAEVVTVAALQTLADGENQFQATFTKAHDVNATATTMPFPRWTGSQSFFYVEVTAAAAVNSVLRAQVDALLQKIARGVTAWATVAPSGGFLGPFAPGIAPLGTSTLGQVVA